VPTRSARHKARPGPMKKPKRPLGGYRVQTGLLAWRQDPVCRRTQGRSCRSPASTVQWHRPRWPGMGAPVTCPLSCRNALHRSWNGPRRATFRVHAANKKHTSDSSGPPSFDRLGRRSNHWIRRVRHKFRNRRGDISRDDARGASSWFPYWTSDPKPLELGGGSTLTLGSPTRRINSRPEHDHD